MAGPSELRLRTVRANGITMQIAEQGDPSKPLVLLMHGWPETWLSWRAQLPALATAGYHAVAPDMRGYGGTDAPQEVGSYDCEHIAKDMLALLNLLGKPCYALVGHDWGAILVWHLGLLHPQAFPRLCAMSVPPILVTSPVPPTSEGMASLYKDRFFYVLYHNECDGRYGEAWPTDDPSATTGAAEREYDESIEAVLRRLYLLGAMGTSQVKLTDFQAPLITDPKRCAGGWRDRLPAWKPGSEMPSWLPEAVFQQYVDSFRKAGFRGGVNYYRCIDKNWRLTRNAFAAAKGKLHQPTLFLAGRLDNVIAGAGGAKKAARQVESLCTDLRGCEFLPDCGHWISQEKPEETNRALIDFLDNSQDLSASGSAPDLRSRL